MFSFILFQDDQSSGCIAELNANTFIRIQLDIESIYRKLKYYWKIDFWKEINENDPIKFRY